jgi:flagellar motility protein MotE (MotC chaperone)
MIVLRRYFRLLPAVFVVGLGVLAIKGVDLARAAQASAANSDAPDNTGLAPADSGGAKPATDFAADTGTADSSAEVDVLTSLTRRRTKLDARERALNMRENVLVAGEARVDQKITALTNLQNQIQALLSQRDAAQDKQIASLVKTYSSMKPKDAARIFDSLADEVLLPVAKGMKSDVLAPVMAAMNPDAAQRLTVKLAMLLKLPEAPAPAACPNPTPMTPASSSDAAPSVPGTTAAVTPLVTPPVQTAALTSPPGATQPPTPAQAAPAVATPPVAAPPPVQAIAAHPPKPHRPAPRRAAVVKPAATPVATVTPATPPTTATAPAKPVTASASTPAKPESTAAISPTTQAALPVTAPAAATAATPAKPAAGSATPVLAAPAASGPPAAITPAKGG